MDFDKNLKYFQNYLKDNKIDVALVVSNNEFLSECADLNRNARYLLSGFTGTAGDMLVTQTKAFLFVDGRYHIQVDEQTNANTITPVKLNMGEKRNDKILEILKLENIKKPKILIPANKISANSFEGLKHTLEALNATFVKSHEDLVCKFFVTNTPKNVYKVWNVGIKYIGKSVHAKLKGLKKYANDFLLVFTNDEICYLANIRSNQNPYSSSLNCFALIGGGFLHIFCELSCIPPELQLIDKKIIYHDFSEFDNFIKKIHNTVFYIPDTTPLVYLEKLNQQNINLKEISNSPIKNKKAIKNKAELNYIKDCYKKSDIGILQALKFLNTEVNKGNIVTAGEFLDKLIEFEKKLGVIALSFNPILAINERSAIIHCTEFDKNAVLKKGDLILLDFGVYFEGGYATDMTRTFAVGNNFKNETLKNIYTIVLKAFLNTINYKINQKSLFFDLDQKARNILKRVKINGFTCNHGIGHGIGLNVHEMPPVLSPSKLSKKKIKANMVFSIEPGLYKEGIGGVRLENSVYTQKTSKGIEIKTLTNLPFDETLIIKTMLNKQEQKWLEKYQENAIK